MAGIEYILGLTIIGGNLTLHPCIPKEWESYFIQYKYGESIYNMKVKNIQKTNEIQTMMLNNVPVPEKQIKLQDNHRINEIEIEL